MEPSKSSSIFSWNWGFDPYTIPIENLQNIIETRELNFSSLECVSKEECNKTHMLRQILKERQSSV